MLVQNHDLYFAYGECTDVVRPALDERCGRLLSLGEGIQMIHGKGRGDAPARLLDQCTGPVGDTALIGGGGVPR